MGHKQPSATAQAEHVADVALAARFSGLLEQAEQAEQEYRAAQAQAAPPDVAWPLARRLDEALTAVMRSAYAAMRAEIGPRGYDDRIFRRQAMAKPAVKTWRSEAERLLTVRETHRLSGYPPRPEGVGVPLAQARSEGHAA